MNKRLVKAIARIKLRIGRGQAYCYEIRNAIILAGMVKILFDINLFYTIILTISLLISFLLIGYIDEHYIKLWQTEAGMRDSVYNPHLRKLNKLK